MNKDLKYTKIEVDGRCLDLLLTDVEISRGVKRATEEKNLHLIPENSNTCWPLEKPPECSFWNRIIGNCNK
jgi:hypothetical protein